MAQLPNVFVPEDEEDNPFEPIPAAWYYAEVIKSKMNQTKDKKGQYLSLGFKVLEGEKEGRIIFTNLNLVNKSDVAVKIAKADLKAICTAIEFEGDLEDSEDLHNRPMYIKVSVKPETDQWPSKNEIKGYKKELEESNPFEE